MYTDDKIKRYVRFAYSVTEATDTHSEYVTLIAVPLQQWLGERASDKLLCLNLLCAPIQPQHPSTIHKTHAKV